MSNNKDSASSTYRKLITGLRDDDLDTINPETLVGGERTLLEILLSSDTPFEYSKSTWQAIFETLSSDAQEKALNRLAQESQLTDRLLGLAIDEEWLPADPSSQLVACSFSGTFEQHTRLNLLKYIRNLDHGWVETILNKDSRFITDEVYSELNRLLDDPKRMFVSLIWAELDDLIARHLKSHKHLRHERPFDLNDFPTTSLETAQTVLEEMSRDKEEWEADFKEALQTGGTGKEEFIQAFLSHFDVDSDLATNLLKLYFERKIGGSISSDLVEALLDCGAEAPEERSYGLWLLRNSEQNAEHHERFERWLRTNNSTNNTELFVEVAIGEALPTAVDTLQEQGYIDRSTAAEGLGELVRQADEAVADEVGVLQILNEQYLEPPSGEPSPFTRILLNIKSNPDRRYAPIAYVLLGRSSGGPQRAEKSRVFSLITEIVSDHRTDRHDDWLAEAVEHLLQRNLIPEQNIVEELSRANNHFQDLFQKHLTGRQERTRNLRSG